MSDIKRSTQESVEAGQVAYDLNEFKTDTTPNTFEPCRQIRANADGTYKFYYAGRPGTAIEMTLTAGETLEHSFVKITGTDDAVVAAKKITVIY